MQVKLFNRYWQGVAILCLAVETVLLYSAALIASRVRFAFHPDSAFFEDFFWLRGGVFTIVGLAALYFNGLYDFGTHSTARADFVAILRSFAFALAGLLALYYSTYFVLTLGRGVLALAIPLAATSVIGWRLILRAAASEKLFRERVLIVGSDEASQALAREILDRRHLGYEVVGFLDDDTSLLGKSLVNPSVLGTTSQVADLAREHRVNTVVVAQSDYRGRLDMDSLLRCKTSGVAVYRGSAFLEELTGKIMLEGLRKSWLIFTPGFQVSPWVRLEKRVLDVLAAAVGFILALPLMALVALAIRIESPGGVLYSQKRVGRGGRVFTVWKFRSMVQDAEASKSPKWAGVNDTRVTRVGRILRKTRLDELPQLWNILVGEMSLVGPRPERPEFVEELSKLSPFYKERLIVAPGLTGWAQISAPYAASFEDSLDKLSYDLYYIRNQSVFLDISIILSTLRTVLLARGAR